MPIDLWFTGARPSTWPRRLLALLAALMLPAAAAQTPAAAPAAASAPASAPALAPEPGPPWPQQALLQALQQQYQALADTPEWREPLPPLPPARAASTPAVDWPGWPPLARRLQRLGDWPAQVALPTAGTPLPQDVLATALQAFQRRHGLTEDGLLGRATLAALNVPPAQRLPQIALTLERLRSAPPPAAPRLVVVNLPEFMLHAYQREGDRLVQRLAMKVVVGRQPDKRTPLMSMPMRYIEFSPYWNVPSSIALEEVLPRLQRQPAWFAQQGFELVRAGGPALTTLSDDALAALQRGEARIRQRPGPENPLGDIKFAFPNADGIYLHHTAAPQLFERSRRDFSHGCVRVQAPVALALFVLQDLPDWTEARIREAMAAGRSRTLALPEGTQVLLSYATVVVRDGRPHFLPDLYGHDARLARAPARRPPG